MIGIFVILFIFIIFLFQRHGQGTEILSCATEYEGRWKENRKHGPGTKKLKTGMTEEQVGIQSSCRAPYHLLGKTGYSGWKIKWFAPSCLGSFRKCGLCFAMIYFFYSVSDLYIVCSGSSSHHVKLYSLIVHAQNYHPDSLCEWWTKSQLVTHCLIFVDQQILLLN